MRVAHAELVLEVGPDRRVVAVDLADGVGVSGCGELVALNVDVVELRDVIADDEVGVEVDRLVDVGQELRREQPVVGLGAEVPVVGELDVPERGVHVEKPDAHVVRLGLASEGDHARRRDVSREHDDVVAAREAGVLDD